MGRWRTAAGVAAACVLLVTLSGSEPADGGTAKALPFPIGTTWVYRHTIIEPGGTNPQTGTLRQVLGQTTYQGRMYLYTERSYSLIPGSMERDYLQWTGAGFLLLGTTAVDAHGNTGEVTFDRAIDLRRRTTVWGTAVFRVNGAERSTQRIIYSSTPRRVETIIVPAGTFRATRWYIDLVLEQIATVATSYVTGHTAIRSEITFIIPGGRGNMWYMALMSGPVR